MVWIDKEDDELLYKVVAPYIKEKYPDFSRLKFDRAFLLHECVRLAVEGVRRNL